MPSGIDFFTATSNSEKACGTSQTLKKGKNEVCDLGGNSVINQEKVSIVGGERTEALLMRYWLHLQHQGCFLALTIQRKH